MESIIEKALQQPGALTRNEIAELLSLEDTKELFTAAYEVKCRYIGKRVSLRGLIEMGNLCAKDCYYCGIRKSNSHVKRYRLAEDDVIRMAKWCFEHDYGSVVLQSGEIESEANTMSIERILHGIREFGGDDFGVTLWMYATPAVYPLSTVSGTLKRLLLLNPVSAPMELYRYALLGVGTLDPGAIAWSVFCSLAVSFLGVVVFSRVERSFVDTV